MVLMNRGLSLFQHAPVLLGALVEVVFLHLWARTISVKQAELDGLVIMAKVFSFQTVTPSGMDRGVVPLAPVAPSTHHHGSM